MCESKRPIRNNISLYRSRVRLIITVTNPQLYLYVCESIFCSKTTTFRTVTQDHKYLKCLDTYLSHLFCAFWQRNDEYRVRRRKAIKDAILNFMIFLFDDHKFAQIEKKRKGVLGDSYSQQYKSHQSICNRKLEVNK